MTEPARSELTSFELFGPEPRERLHRIWSSCWIDYPIALQALKRLEWLLNHPRVTRPPCCLIVGETNHGKTTIARKFERMHQPDPGASDEAKSMPVVYVQAPPMADVAGFYGNILNAVGAPFMPTWSASRKQDLVLKTLTNLGTKMLIVDELHSILQGKIDQRGVFLNVLKHLTNELQIPIVGLGTREILRVVQTDQQFGNRFEPFTLPKWELGPGYATFLAHICRRTGMKDVSFMKDKALVRRIHTMSEGLTGESWKVVCFALERMEETGRSALEPKILDEIDWTAPKDRRRQA